MGFAALKDLGDGAGEVKSMRTAPAYLRRGVAGRLVETIIETARGRGFGTLFLETGTNDAYLAARRFYEGIGFVPCDPFADYEVTGHNYFMRLML